jgi:hypothetical protein
MRMLFYSATNENMDNTKWETANRFNTIDWFSIARFAL